mgnify:CR=1 FL=1
MKLRLYNYWRSSSSYRIRLALHYKQLAFEYIAVSLIRGEQHQPEHRDRNPIGTVPLLEIDDGSHVVRIPQSIAIAEFLEERFPERSLFPKSAIDRAHVRALAETVNSGIQPFQNLATLNYVKTELKADEKAWAQYWIRTGLELLEHQAAPRAGLFMLGDTFTWADCCLLPQVYSARRFGIDLNAFATLSRIEQNCLKLECVEKSRPEIQPDALV